MKTSISQNDKTQILDELKVANLAFMYLYPGDSPNRQPVHTVYGGAQLFKETTITNLGKIAQRSLASYAPNFVVLAQSLELPKYDELPDNEENINALTKELEELSAVERKQHKAWLPYTVYEKVKAKLEREAVEDFRIDFEDGFGNRPDDEEDATAEFTALETAKAMQNNSLSPFIGIRIKPFTEELKERSVRTLDIFVSTLVAASNGKLPDNFIVTLPKVSIPEQVTALIQCFEIIEKNTGLQEGDLKMEFMVETTQSIMDSEGANALRAIVKAAQGRCIGAHFGTYDYTASCNITANYQVMDHPVCDFAHHMMRVALGQTGIFLSDGATNVMPVGPYRGKDLTAVQMQENMEVVHGAWKIGYDHIRHSLWHGYYQGWDLNPAQLPVRYAAVFSFFLENYDAAAQRLHNFMEKAGQATLSGDVFDDAATGQGLLNYFLKALNCGAINEGEIAPTGLTLEEIQSRSFAKILKDRMG